MSDPEPETDTSTPPRRRYHSPVREAAARATHQAIVDAAGRMFAKGGYHKTPLSEIAREAGVSVQRVHLAGSKASLLVSAYRQSIGTEPRNPDEDAAASGIASIASLMELPGDEALEAYGHWAVANHRRSAGLWFALRGAADSDPEVAVVIKDVRAENTGLYRGAIAWAAGVGLTTAPEPTWSHRADTWSVLGSAESWRHLVLESGWDVDEYRTWLVDGVRRLVLG